MAGTPFAPFQQFGQDYAQGQASAQQPGLDFLRRKLAAFKTSDQVSGEVGDLFKGAINTGQNVGANVSNIGSGFLSSLAGLGTSLPGFDSQGLVDASRQTARGGASASMLGSVITSEAQGAQGNAILQARQRLAEDRLGTEGELAGEESRVAGIAADWMPAAAQRQGMAGQAIQNESGRLNNRAAREAISRFPAERRAAALNEQIQKGQITEQSIANWANAQKAGLTTKKQWMDARRLWGISKNNRAGGGAGGGTGGGSVPAPAGATS